MIPTRHIGQLSRKGFSLRLLLLLVLLVCSTLARTARVLAQNITFDSSASSGAFYPTLDPMVSPTLTWSHTVVSKTDRILVVSVSTTTTALVSSPTDRVTSVTYGSTPLTRIGTRVASDQRSAVEMFHLVGPVPGTDSITVNLIPAVVSYAVGGSVSFAGINQLTPERTQASDVFAANSGTSAAPTVSVISATTDVVVDTVAISTEGGFLVPDASQTLLWNGRSFFATAFDVGSGSHKSGAPVTTMSWSSSNTQPWAVGAISLRSSALPTAASASISGRVTMSDGVPVGGVTVSLNGPTTSRAITNSDGTYFFSNLENGSFLTLTPERANYVFNPASMSFSLIANKADAVFTALPTAQTENPLDSSPEFFVRQHYLDFLRREPDQAGLAYWSARLTECDHDAGCINASRIQVSAAFFASPEFQQTSSYIYRLYLATLGRQLSYQEFVDDHRQLKGGPNLERERVAFADEFVQRREFIDKYQSQTTAEAFVEALLQAIRQSLALDLSASRAALLATYQSGDDLNHSRRLTVTAAIDNEAFRQSVYNSSFVLMQYFGYLQRNPDAQGFDFWTHTLNGRAPGNFRGMVCAFLTSTEYQLRFSSVITHSNADCN